MHHDAGCRPPETMCGSMPSPLFAVVKVGKGHRPEGLTQNGGMVKNGKPPADQTKNTKCFSRGGKKYGKQW